MLQLSRWRLPDARSDVSDHQNVMTHHSSTDWSSWHFFRQIPVFLFLTTFWSPLLLSWLEFFVHDSLSPFRAFLCIKNNLVSLLGFSVYWYILSRVASSATFHTVMDSATWRSFDCSAQLFSWTDSGIIPSVIALFWYQLDWYKFVAALRLILVCRSGTAVEGKNWAADCQCYDITWQ